MAIKDTYTKAINFVLNGEMTKEELVEVIEEHLSFKQSEVSKAYKLVNEYRQKYLDLLSRVNKAHEEHKKIFDESLNGEHF